MIAYVTSFLNRESANQFMRLVVIGGFNTVLDFGIFNLLRGVLGVPSQLSVAIAFTIATFVSYLLNRRFTFSITDGHVSARETALFFLVNGAAYVVTAALVFVAQRWIGDELLILNGAKVVATVFVLFPKFAGYRDVVFRRSVAKVDRS